MNTHDVLTDKAFQKCVDFHGHMCPGLATGYRAAHAGLEWLKENRSEDEEIVAIVETDACSADSVQVLTGCTFGKGNFFYKDHGKMAFTFFSRRTGSGIRFVLKPTGMDISERHKELMGKIRKNEATALERKEFQEIHISKTRDILEKPLNMLFTSKEVRETIPNMAMIEPSEICSRCGEPVMASKLKKIGEESVCRNCE